MKATLKNYRQSPRKVRLVADTICGKKVPYALAMLQSVDKKVSEPMRKLIQSAVQNAQESGKNAESLVIGGVIVNQGIMMKRNRPRAFGRVAPLRRRTSTIQVTLQ